MNEPCKFHPGLQDKINDVSEDLAEVRAYSKGHKEQIEKLFTKLEELTCFVAGDQVETRHQAGDIHALLAASKELEKAIDKVQRAVDNGLNARVDNLAKAVGLMTNCIEQREKRQIDSLEDLHGWSYFVHLIGYSLEEQFRKYAGLIVIAMVATLIYIVTHMPPVENFVKGIFE